MEINKIGFNKYNALKKYDLLNLDETQMQMFSREFPRETIASALKAIKEFDKTRALSSEAEAKRIEYLKSVREPKEELKEIIPTSSQIWKYFLKVYKEQNGCDFNYSNQDTVKNIEPLLYYLSDNFEKFKLCDNLTKLSQPSLEKGMLIIGGYGNGKSSIMRALDKCLIGTTNTFKLFSANDVVHEFETTKNDEKVEFDAKYLKGKRCFDDVLTEKVASNYGKVDVFKDIIERRYDKKLITHINCNFIDGEVGNLDSGLAQFENRYGGRVYDRLFSMFNIIQFKGNSFRK